MLFPPNQIMLYILVIRLLICAQMMPEGITLAYHLSSIRLVSYHWIFCLHGFLMLPSIFLDSTYFRSRVISCSWMAEERREKVCCRRGEGIFLSAADHQLFSKKSFQALEFEILEF